MICEPVASTEVITESNEETNAEDVEDVAVPKNIGHLHEEPVEITCPACYQKCLTKVELEAVTCLQKYIAVINLCCNLIKWSGRYDFNHYCSKCGCYIGRDITLSWYKRKVLKMKQLTMESDNKWQRFKNIEKEKLDKSKLGAHAKNIEKA